MSVLRPTEINDNMLVSRFWLDNRYYRRKDQKENLHIINNAY